MSEPSVPPIVAAVEAALGTRVLSLRYLPSPTAAAAAAAMAALSEGQPPQASGGGAPPGRPEQSQPPV